MTEKEMETMTDEAWRMLIKHIKLARQEILKTTKELADEGIALTAIHIIFREGVIMTEQKMREAGTTEQGITNCKMIAEANIRNDLV